MEMRMRTISVSGSPYEMGFQHGEMLSNQIQDFIKIRNASISSYSNRRGPTEIDINEFANRSIEVFRRWDQYGHDELVGIAEGAKVDTLRLFAASNMTDMRDSLYLQDPSGPRLDPTLDEGCTSIMAPRTQVKNGYNIAGQTWDLNSNNEDHVVAIKRNPLEGPCTWSVTCGGCLTLMGINEYGLAIGTTNIKTYGVKPGAGYLSILHRAIRCDSVNEASEIIAGAPHAGAHTYWLCDEHDQIEWEASPANSPVSRDTTNGPIHRTNHCLSEENCLIEGEVVGESSEARYNRVEALLRGNDLGPEELKEIFCDRSDGILSVCRHPEDDQVGSTNAAFIAIPKERRAIACRGPADRGSWIDLTF